MVLPKTIEWNDALYELPKDDNVKLVICVTKAGKVSWNRAYYDGKFWHGSGSMSNVTYWADFDIGSDK